MKNTFILCLVILLSSAFISCNENDSPIGIHGKVELYEIDQFETINNTDQIDESTVITKKTPLLNYEDLLSYNSKEFKFILSEHAQQVLEGPPIKTSAFAIKANGELIYTGYFVPGYSSRLWFYNVINPLMASFNGECNVL